MTTDEFNRLRFEEPLYTAGEAARILRVPVSTLATWLHGYTRRPPGGKIISGAPVITAVRNAKRYAPEVPFVGLVEGMVATAFRAAGVSMQHIRKALPVIERELGIEHALASKGLLTDGAQILYDYSSADPDLGNALTVVVTKQQLFTPVIEQYLSRIEFASDGWAQKMVVPGTKRRIVEVDPRRAFGRPLFISGGARVEDVLDRFRAGDALSDVARDFGVQPSDLEDVLRATIPRAA